VTDEAKEGSNRYSQKLIDRGSGGVHGGDCGKSCRAVMCKKELWVVVEMLGE
jgi:hypothetical protein